MIFTAYKKKNAEKDGHGQHGNSGRAVTPDMKAGIREQLESFPVIDAHYCKAETRRKYIEGTITLI